MRSVHNVEGSAFPPLVIDDDGEEDSCHSTESGASFKTGSQSFSIEGPSVSGRGSVASSFEDRQRSVSVETIKCALCSEMFADNERLQQHTQTHFAGDSTEVLREQLLKKWNGLSTQYRAAVPEVTSPQAWFATWGIDEGD